MIEILQEECNQCNLPTCVSICPTGAFQKNPKKNGASWNQDRCIGCGHCVRLIDPEQGYSCKGVRPVQNYSTVQKWIDSKITFAVSVGPGLEYYNSRIQLQNVIGAWQKLGAKQVIRAVEVAPIATPKIIKEIHHRWNAGERLIIDSRCGTLRNITDTIRPDLKSCLIKSDSILYTSCKMAVSDIDNCPVVYLGPDVAYKKQLSIHSSKLPLDATITWIEFEALCQANAIDLKTCYGGLDSQGTGGRVPRAGDLRKGVEVAGIPYISLEHRTPHEIVMFFESLVVDKTIGFVSGLFCGSCIKGPGVYAHWKEDQEFNQIKSSIILEEKNNKNVNECKDSSPKQKDSTLSHDTNSTKVILNGIEVVLSNSKIEDSKNNSEITLLIEESTRKVWVLKNLFEFSGRKRAFGLLQMIASNPPGTILKYEDILKQVWLEDSNDMLRDNMKDKINKVFNKEIRILGNKKETLHSYIETIAGVGIKSSLTLTTLLIPHSPK